MGLGRGKRWDESHMPIICTRVCFTGCGVEYGPLLVYLGVYLTLVYAKAIASIYCYKTYRCICCIIS